MVDEHLCFALCQRLTSFLGVSVAFIFARCIRYYYELFEWLLIDHLRYKEPNCSACQVLSGGSDVSVELVIQDALALSTLSFHVDEHLSSGLYNSTQSSQNRSLALIFPQRVF